MMDWIVAIAAVIAAVSAIVAVLVSYRFERQIRHEDRLTEHRVKMLMEAYRAIENASLREPNEDRRQAFEAAFADIVLLGDAEEVAAALALADALAAGSGADATFLLKLLRQKLRRELKLEEVQDFQILRMG